MKLMQIYRRYGRHLVWVGAMLIIMGVSAGAVAGSWLPIPGSLILAGLGVISFGVFEARAATVPNAIAATVAVLVILGAVNFLAVRYGARLDLTENQILSLAPQSQELVRNLRQPVKVWVFDRNPNPADRELLASYSRAGPLFSYEFVDPQLRVGTAEQFQVQSNGEVYLESGTKRQKLPAIGPQQRLSEVSITNAIEAIGRDRSSVIYFLQGHGEPTLEPGERSFSRLGAALEQKGNPTRPLNLATGLPQDVGVLVIGGVRRSLLDGEVKLVTEYLENGGNLLLLLDPRTTTGLADLLQAWGISLDEKVVIDGSGSGQVIGLGPATTLINEYGDHPITKGLTNGISLFPLGRSLTIKPVQGVSQFPLVITSDRVWAEANPERQPFRLDSEADQKGPLTLAVAMSRPGKDRESRLVVFGNATFATDGWFEQQLNGDLVLNSLAWLEQQEKPSLGIRPRAVANRRINLSPTSAIILGWTALVILPLTGLITAGVVWWQQR